jgi:RAT1-interacting protein
VVGFRTAAGRISQIQFLKTLEIPRLVRGKENAWDPLLCLAWGDKLFTFLTSIVSGPEGQASRVWRVKFIPRRGVKVWLLNEDEVKEVENGEERAGFLPKWYWNGEKEPISGCPSAIAPSLVELPGDTAR